MEKVPMRCRCRAALEKCDHTNKWCPASTGRLLYDTQAAMRELKDFAIADLAEQGIIDPNERK